MFDPWVGKFPGEGNGNPLQYSCLENPMNGGAWCPWGRKELDTTERLHFHPKPSVWERPLSDFQFSSVAQLCLDSLLHHGLQHTKPPCPSPTPGASSNSYPSSQWCHPTISSSIILSSSHLLSFPASGSFPMSQFFTSSGQSIGVSASASVHPVNIQDWFPLGWVGWISLQSKGLSRVFSNTTVQKHQFFGV